MSPGAERPSGKKIKEIAVEPVELWETRPSSVAGRRQAAAQSGAGAGASARALSQTRWASPTTWHVAGEIRAAAIPQRSRWRSSTGSADPQAPVNPSAPADAPPGTALARRNETAPAAVRRRARVTRRQPFRVSLSSAGSNRSRAAKMCTPERRGSPLPTPARQLGLRR